MLLDACNSHTCLIWRIRTRAPRDNDTRSRAKTQAMTQADGLKRRHAYRQTDKNVRMLSSIDIVIPLLGYWKSCISTSPDRL